MENIVHNKQLDNIYNKISDLNLMKLNQLMTKIVGLRKQKLTTVLPHTETKLLRNINKGLPIDIQKRYDYLLEKKNDETLNDKEYQELLEITSYSENFNARRLVYIVELAKIRNKTIDELISELELNRGLDVA